MGIGTDRSAMTSSRLCYHGVPLYGRPMNYEPWHAPHDGLGAGRAGGFMKIDAVFTERPCGGQNHRPTWFLALSNPVTFLHDLRGNPYGHHQPPPPILLHVKNCLFGSTSAAPHSTISTFYPDTMVQTPPAGLEVSDGAKHSDNCAAVASNIAIEVIVDNYPTASDDSNDTSEGSASIHPPLMENDGQGEMEE